MAPIEVNGGAAAEKPSKHNKLVIIGSGPAGRE
jgi:thioredoxin reductase (NADPH)